MDLLQWVVLSTIDFFFSVSFLVQMVKFQYGKYSKVFLNYQILFIFSINLNVCCAIMCKSLVGKETDICTDDK